MSLWYWAAFALILGIAELFTGTAYLLCLSVAALLTTFMTAIFPELSALAQGSLFALLAIASTGLWFIRNKYRAHKTTQQVLNQKAYALIGRKITLTENMQDYRGHVMIDGVLWRIKATENYSAGTVVIVKGIEAMVLNVQPVGG